MSNQVLTVSSDHLLKMKNHYEKGLVNTPPNGAVFSAKTGGCTITGYKSGKVLFQGKDAATEASKWASIASSTSPSTKKKPNPFQKTKQAGTPLPAGFSSLSVIGSDEVGTGDYFGPITVCAAYVRKEDMDILKQAGVKDSKALTDEKICAIAKEILPFVPYSLLVLHNDKYNEMQKTMTQGKMKAILHNKALENVLAKIGPDKPEAILIDQFAEADVYYRHLSKQPSIVKEKVFFQTKAEGLHLSVAAASIIARYAFLREMDKISSLAGFTIPKGAGAIVDKAAARFIRTHGQQKLGEVAKLHFANTEKAKKIL
ncbi:MULTISPECIES: ribonuclease HIII [Bacillus]|uniref:ribonuclease HIII n=1 Tax=Bacillus TaxID=1386 RepID=UPI000BB8596E|nr:MULTISPECIES: ribonuclease HIII [Bacillus]